MKKLTAGLAKARVFLSGKINQILLGKISGNVPYTIVNSIEEDCYRPTLSKHIKRIITVSEATIQTYSFPEQFPANFRRSKAFDKKNLYLLHNVSVSPFSGLTWIKNHHCLLESTGSLYRAIGWDNILHEPLLVEEKLEEQEYVVSCPSNAFYHWLYESLSGLLIALDTVPTAKVMIASDCPKYARDVLDILFGEQTKERIIVADTAQRIRNFITVHQEPDAGFAHPSAIKVLQQFRDRTLQQDKTIPMQAAPYIYVSRSKTRNRQLANELEVEKALASLGFKIIYCEDLTMSQQIAVFSQATCIIAPHGAALSNIVWARNKVRLFEIFAHGHFNDCFARVAVSLGFDYAYTVAKKHKGSNGKINVEEVVAAAKALLNEKEEISATLNRQPAQVSADYISMCG